jgi:parallel beta-helix repeat protein
MSDSIIINVYDPQTVLNVAATSATAAATLSLQNYTGVMKVLDVITKSPWVDVRAFGAKGDGITDDRLSIQNAINQGGTVRFTAGTYNIGFMIPASYPIGFDVQDNTHIIIDKNVTIKCVANDYTHYYIFNIDGKTNVVIEGGIIIGDRDSHTGTTGEWGFGVRINNSSYITVRNVTVKNCWGDGFVISGNSYNVVLDNCISYNNRRQGCSITGGEYIYVNKGSYGNTNGTDPQAGIDIEPNSPVDKIKNILIDGVDFSNNVGSGLEINIMGLATVSGTPDEVRIFIDDCTFSNNSRGLTYVCSSGSPQINTVTGIIKVTNPKLKNNTDGLCIYNIVPDIMPKLVIDDIDIDGWSNYAIRTTTALTGDTLTSTYGGFEIYGAHLKNPPATLPSPAAAILLNPTGTKKINAIIKDIEVSGMSQQQTVYWTRGDGNITFKSPSIITDSAYTYEFVNGLNISYSSDITFYLPQANYHKDKEYTLVHTGQANAFRVGLATGTDKISGITELVTGIANMLYIAGANYTFKSDGIDTWNVVNKVGKILPLGYTNERRVVYGNTFPTTGTWNRGDIVRYTNAYTGSNSEWICTVAGTPGTWQPSGLIGQTKLTVPTDSTATDIAGLNTKINELLANIRTAKI